MIIVSGEFRVDGAQRDDFVAGQVDNIKASRAQAGCIDYSFLADPVEADRVVLYERWEDQASLDAHLSGPRTPSTRPDIAATSHVVVIYDVAGERPLR